MIGTGRSARAGIATAAGRSLEGVGGIFKDRPRPTPDVVVFLVMAGLLALGTLMVYSATYVRLEAETGDPGAAMRRQMMFAGAALAAFVALSMVDYRMYRRMLVPIYGATTVVLVLLLFTSTHRGVSRWLQVGPVRFQPSEFAKVALVVVLAGYLAGRQEGPLRWRNLASVLAMTAVPGYLIFRQPDLGTMLVIGFIAIGMLYVAGAGVRQIAVLLAAGVGGVAAVLRLDVLRDYQLERLAGFLDQTADLQGANWSLNQSQIAIGSGQLFGRGLFEGSQTRLNFIPAQTSDFIFTAVGEQFGFIGGAALLVVYAVLIWRVLVVATGVSDPFGALIAVGMACLLAFHVFVNIGMTIGLVPVTGLPLPFMSAGGSAMIAMAAGLGMVNSIWRSRSPLDGIRKKREGATRGRDAGTLAANLDARPPERSPTSPASGIR